MTATRDYVREDDSGLLEKDSRAVDPIHQFHCRSRNLKRVRRWDGEFFRRHVVVLRQVLPETVATGEYRHAARCRVLPPHGAAATGSKRCHRSLEVLLGGNHLPEAPAGGDGLPVENLRSVDAGVAVQLQPGLVTGLMEVTPHPFPGLVRQLQGRSHTKGGELSEGPGANAPDIGEVEHRKGLAAFRIGVYHADPFIALVLLGELAGYLGQCLGPGYAPAAGGQALGMGAGSLP